MKKSIKTAKPKKLTKAQEEAKAREESAFKSGFDQYLLHQASGVIAKRIADKLWPNMKDGAKRAEIDS